MKDVFYLQWSGVLCYILTVGMVVVRVIQPPLIRAMSFESHVEARAVNHRTNIRSEYIPAHGYDSSR